MQQISVSSSAWTLNAPRLRAAVAEAAVAAFSGRALAMGRCDCVHLADFVLARLGIEAGLARGGSYRSELGALRALGRTGFASLEAAIDSLGLERIAPSARRPADLLALPGEGRLSALHVALTNGVTLGWGEGEAVCTTWRPTLKSGLPVVCWRVLAKPQRILPGAPVRVIAQGEDA